MPMSEEIPPTVGSDDRTVNITETIILKLKTATILGEIKGAVLRNLSVFEQWELPPD